MQRPKSPIIEALDLNHNGIIEADEIFKASESLKKLDKNGDGKLSEDEIRPPRQNGQGGPAGQGQGGAGGGQGGPGGKPPGGKPPGGPQGGGQNGDATRPEPPPLEQ